MLRKTKSFIIILLSMISFSAFAQKGIIDSILIANRSITTVEGKVSEVQYLKSGKTKNCQGKVYYASPEQIAFLLENEDEIKVNGNKIYFDHGMFHGTFNAKKSKLVNGLKCLLLYSFQGKCQELADECNYYMKTEEKNGEYLVTFTAKKKRLIDFSTVVLHYNTSYKLKEIEYTATTGDHSCYILDSVKYCGEIEDVIFKF